MKLFISGGVKLDSGNDLYRSGKEKFWQQCAKQQLRNYHSSLGCHGRVNRPTLG